MKRFVMHNRFFWLFLVVMFALPVLPHPVHVPEYWITLLNYIGLYSIVAIGLVLLTGIGGMTSFGQAAFVGLGAYATAYLTTQYGVSPWLALIVGVVITALVALVLGLVTMRLSGHFLPLGTIAWGLALFFLFGNLDMLGKYDGINGIPVLNVLGIDLESGRHIYYLIWVVVLASVVSVQNLLNSRMGRAIRALRGGGMMAEAMGVNTGWMRVVIFVYAAVLAAVSGFLYAHLQRAVNPTPFGLNHGIEYLFMAVVGGVAHVWGAVLGAAILTVLQDWLQTLLPKLLGENGNFEIIVFGILMVLLLQYARRGVWPFVARFFPRGPQAHVPEHAEALPQRSKPATGEMLLTVNKARKQFGGLVAVNDVSFEVKAGQIIGLIGPNGAGKSTLLNAIMGALPVTGHASGRIAYMGEEIGALPIERRVARGMCLVPEKRELFASMTVEDNLVLGAYRRKRAGERNFLDQLEPVFTLFPRLKERRAQAAGTLSGGERQMLAVGRALMGKPDLLMLDEPSLGLAPLIVKEIFHIISALRQTGVATLLIEQNARAALQISDYGYVLET
ncbi:ABC transporter permease subunit, partial [Paraburkholderia sp. BR14261]